MKSGTAICPVRIPAPSTVSARTARISRNRGIASIRTSCCSTPTRKKLVGPWRWSDALFGYRVHSNRLDMSMDRRDSAPAMPKCIVTDDAFDWSRDVRPDTPVGRNHRLRNARARRIDDAQRHPPARTRHVRGALVAVVHRAPAEARHHRRRVPAGARVPERPLSRRAQSARTTGATTPPRSSRPSLRICRRIGSTKCASPCASCTRRASKCFSTSSTTTRAKATNSGPTVSWRGLDNASYYRLIPGDERHYINETGCGNTLNLSHPRVLQMVMDSLRYWCTAFNIDGFRFDLGVTLGREGHGFDPGSGFFDAVRQDPDPLARAS